MVGPARSWPLPAEGWPAVLFLHRVRDTVIRDKAVPRGTPKGWMLKGRQLTSLEWNNGIRNQATKWQLRLRKEMATSSGIRGWSKRQELHLGSMKTLHEALRRTLKLWSEQSGFPRGCGKWVTGHCGGVGHPALTGGSWWWYTWTNRHLRREPLVKSSLEEGAFGE
jgi:hypothetical protein